MNRIITFKFLPTNDFKHLRIIRCYGNEYNKFSSFVFYLRDFEYEKLDELDEAILASFNENHHAIFQMNTKILFENQLQEIIDRFTLQEKRKHTVQLSPIATDKFILEAQAGRPIYSYIKEFNIWFSPGYNFQYFHNHIVAYIDADNLEYLQKTITPL